MDEQQKKNLEEKDINYFYIAFYILFMILILSVISLLFFRYNDLNSAKEFMATSCVILIPLLFPKLKIGYKLVISGILWIIFTFIGYTFASSWVYMNMSPATIITVPFSFCFLLSIAGLCYYFLNRIKEIKNEKAKIIIIIILTLITIFCICMSFISIINNMNAQSTEFNNIKILSEIKCMGAYIAVNPDGLRLLCNQINPPPNAYYDWSGIKKHCYDVVENIRADPYYFDSQSNLPVPNDLRSPANYIACGKNAILPEVVDPSVCDHIGRYLKSNSSLEDPDAYFFKINGEPGLDCYSRLAIKTGNSSWCDKSAYSQWCHGNIN